MSKLKEGNVAGAIELFQVCLFSYSRGLVVHGISLVIPQLTSCCGLIIY